MEKGGIMNPLKQETKDLNSYFFSFEEMYPTPYPTDASPYTKCRVILLNGLEFESNCFGHQLARHTCNNDINRDVAVIRKQEQMQQKRISCLKPIDESILETTISYEQLAIDLTATLAQNEKNKNNIEALNFALLEDFDHLYRFSNLYLMDQGKNAETVVGKFTEIMPARPTLAHHRYPKDEVKKHMNGKTADLYSKLSANIITAAEQQTMNFYMNIAQWYKNDLGRQLFAEIGMVEEEHVTQYESLKDPSMTFLEMFVMHEYTECYLYYSCMEEEKDENLKTIWQQHYEMECAHLKKACEMLEQYEGTSYTKVIGSGEFPTLLKLGTNKQYIRDVIERTTTLTANRESYKDVCSLKPNVDFFKIQNTLIPNEQDIASHRVVQEVINKYGKDYRYQDSKSPLKELTNRKQDNTTLGRTCSK